MILQLNPTIPVRTKLGRGRALLIIDYGTELNSCWVVALNSNGQIKHFNSNDLILEENYTFGTNSSIIPKDWKTD